MADRLSSLTNGLRVWETYLSDPDMEPDPATWRTLIVWPVVGDSTAHPTH
jgi:hypothetical protein